MRQPRQEGTHLALSHHNHLRMLARLQKRGLIAGEAALDVDELCSFSILGRPGLELDEIEQEQAQRQAVPQVAHRLLGESRINQKQYTLVAWNLLGRL